MAMSKSQRSMLTEDGELRPVDPETGEETASPEAQPKAVFCCNCGTANKAQSQYCRNCGQSLEEQLLNPAELDQYAPPEMKNKRFLDLIAQAGQHSQEDKASQREGAVLFFLAVLTAVSIAAHEILLALAILVVFFAIIILRRWVMPRR